MEEVKKVQRLAKEFEDKLNTIWTKEQIQKLRPQQEAVQIIQ